MKNKFCNKLFTVIIIANSLIIPTVNACSRLTYTAGNKTVVTGRSMDWMSDTQTELWAFPAGIKRTGAAGLNSVEWVSKYGSVIASGFNIGTADGIDTEGLTVNLLYLSDANYGKPQSNQKNLSVLLWAQYILDNYATVNSAVEDLSKDNLHIVGAALPPNGDPAALHIAITDSTGDNAILEYINSKLTIHHGKQFNVMTNEPSYDKQLALMDYWREMNGVFLPGTHSPEDRFVRASYYVNTALQTTDEQKSIATVFSIIRNVSTPLIGQVSDRPNFSSTLWRTVADLKNKRYYFEATNKPNVFWVDLSSLKLSIGSPIKKLPLLHGEIYAGEVSKKFVNSAPFVVPVISSGK